MGNLLLKVFEEVLMGDLLLKIFDLARWCFFGVKPLDQGKLLANSVILLSTRYI